MYVRYTQPLLLFLAAAHSAFLPSSLLCWGWCFWARRWVPTAHDPSHLAVRQFCFCLVLHGIALALDTVLIYDNIYLVRLAASINGVHGCPSQAKAPCTNGRDICVVGSA